LIESAVTPGALALSPLCFAVSLVQNAVFDVNGDDAGSGVVAAVAAGAATAIAGSTSANVNRPTSPDR
jgi:hypothetical protein